MLSGYSPFWKRFLYKVPFLFKKCPAGNYHWFWHKYCYCRVNEIEVGNWNGGIYNFKTKKEQSDKGAG